MRAKATLAFLALVAGCSESPAARPPADAGLAGDAQDPDARADGEAGAGPSFCERLQPKPALCADFDRGDVAAGWDPPVLAAGGTVATDAASREGPLALLATTPTTTLAKRATAALTRAFPPSFTGALSLAFDVNVAGRCYDDDGAGYAVAVIQLTPAYVLSLVTSKASAQLTPAAAADPTVSTSANKLTFAALKTDAYAHVTIDVRVRAASQGTVKVIVDDPPVDTSGAIQPPVPNDGAGVAVGLWSVAGLASQGCDVRLDNVVFAAQR
jgi:hypothetical protein